MKPLLKTDISALLTRIDHGIDGELKSITMNTPQNFTIEFSVQDKKRGYDWINIAFEIDSINSARLVDNNKVNLIDMSEGITILSEENSFAIAIGKYKSIEALQDATAFLSGQSIKYEEKAFIS